MKWSHAQRARLIALCATLTALTVIAAPAAGVRRFIAFSAPTLLEEQP